MGGNVVKQGLRQQQRSLSERITALEQGFARVLFSINQRLSAFEQRFAMLTEQIEALVELNGIEDVQRIISEKRLERARAASEQEKASLEEGIRDGYVLGAETVGEKSVLVGRYVGKDGGVEQPGRTQLVMPGLKEEFREKLLGQSVGYKLDLPNGSHFDLQEIYNIDEEKAKEVEAAKAQAEASAATKQAADTAARDEQADAEEGTAESQSK